MIGLLIREKLIEAGSSGIVPTDLHHEFKSQGLTKATYGSFIRYFHRYKELGWVTETGQTEESSQPQLENTPYGYPRTYYRITPKGKRVEDWRWNNPVASAWSGTPNYQANREAWSEYMTNYMREWRAKQPKSQRGRGRPRKVEAPL